MKRTIPAPARRRAALLGATILSGAFVAAAPAAAQDESASEDRIVVTGTRIATRDATANSPIFTIDAEAMSTSGYVTAEQYINTLPQVAPNLSSQSNNPSSNGRALIDLRGLGPQRNLVLIDGRRGMGSTGGGNAAGAGNVVDVNTIPVSLIERVELITGGAGATYGPDAVSGVVNFIMKKSFEGFELDGQYRITEQGDGQEYNVDATFGGSFLDGRGGSVFNVSYFKRDAMYSGARPFSAQSLTTTGSWPGGSWEPDGNPASQGAVDALFGPGACAASGGTNGFGFNPDGSLFCSGIGNGNPLNVVGYTGPQSHIATTFFPDQFSYNFSPENILVLPMERLSFFTAFNLDLESWFKPYVQAMFTNYNAEQELAATPASNAANTGFAMPVTNPFIPADLAALLASRTNPNAPFNFGKRFTDTGGRTGYNNIDVFNIVTGATGDIVGSWGYDVYLQYGRSSHTEIQGGNIRRDRVQNMLDAVDGGAALSGCGEGINLFGAAPISQCMQNYILLEAKNLRTLEQVVVEGVVSGDLFELPAGAVSTAFGASYRFIDFKFQPDSGLQPGLVAGFNQQLPTAGFLNFTDFFAEVHVPILADMPFARLVSITGGWRTTDNSQTGTADTWKLTGDWAVNDHLRFRGGYQHAVRSPNVLELFAPQLNNFPNIANQDPCNFNSSFRTGPNAAQVAALCAAQSGVAGGPAFVQPQGQATGLTGGNPNLQPELADSWTIGLVARSPWESPWLERLSLSVDYWNIAIEDAIAATAATIIIQRCYNADNANPTYSLNNQWCNLFERGANGGIINLLQASQNQALLQNAGIDVAMNWGFGLDQVGLGASAGELNFNLSGTWLQKATFQNSAADPVNDFKGTISAITGGSSPEFKANLVTTYSRDDLQLQVVTRFIDAMRHANTVTGGVVVPPTPTNPLGNNTSVASTWYVDLLGRYNLTEAITVRAGVNNLLNQEPRCYNPNIQACTDPSLYDVLGRRFFFGVNIRM